MLRPLDETAFFDLMSEAQDEMQAWDKIEAARIEEAAKKALLDPALWDWVKDMPPVVMRRGQDGHERFRLYLQRYIDQLADLRKAGYGEDKLPEGHPAKVYGDKISTILHDDVQRQRDEQAQREHDRMQEVLARQEALLNQQYSQLGYQQYDPKWVGPLRVQQPHEEWKTWSPLAGPRK